MEHRCVLSDKVVLTIGSKKDAIEGKAEGVSTEIGIISRDLISEYERILEGCRKSQSKFSPTRKRVIAVIDGVPSRKFAEILYEQGLKDMPPGDKNEYFRRSQI